MIWILSTFPVGLVLGFFGKFLWDNYHRKGLKRTIDHAWKEAQEKEELLLTKARLKIAEQYKEKEKKALQGELELKRDKRHLEKLRKHSERVRKHLKDQQEILEQQHKDLADRLEKVAGLDAETAKAMFLEEIREASKRQASLLANKIEEEAIDSAEKKAKHLLASTLQRVASEITSELTITTVNLPNEEMKGRIIGREGRNIRSLETLTGVDIIIDDTPENVIISCFDPIRKMIAKTTLEKLIVDGRIHPAKIEETVFKVSQEMHTTIFEMGEKVLLDLNIPNLPKDLIRALGRLHFRTSFGQNVLSHSKEVAIIGGMLASEMGIDKERAKRACLLHDIGKGMENDTDMSHAEIGAKFLKQQGESEVIVNAVASHHNEVEPNSVEAILVQVADAVSAARPGARRTSLEHYVKRLENLEKIVSDFPGVERSYAIQAGREIRVIVNNEKISDDDASVLARNMAKKIEDELSYPGKLKITLIRETRITEYAR